MKKLVHIIGVGLGRSTLSSEAKKTIKNSQVIIGDEEVISCYTDLKCDFFPTSVLNDIVSIVKNASKERFSILFPGDIGFFSPALELGERLSELDVRFIPGISALNYFAAKCRLPWTNAGFYDINSQNNLGLIDIIRRNQYTYVCTKGQVKELGSMLLKYGYGDLSIHVGEKLGNKHEMVYPSKVSEMCKLNCPKSTMILFENPDFDRSVQIGVSDCKFTFPEIGANLRALIMSKLQIKSNFVCYEINCKNAALATEMALNAFEGSVYAIDSDESFLSTVKDNCYKFKLGNLNFKSGNYNQVFDELPSPDTVFINGYENKTDEIVDKLLDKNEYLRIVITADNPQDCSRILTILEDEDFELELTQVFLSSGYKSRGTHILTPQLPMYLISGQRLKPEEE